MVVGVGVQREKGLTAVVQAVRRMGLPLRRIQRRKKKPCKDRHDGNHHKEFYEGKMEKAVHFEFLQNLGLKMAPHESMRMKKGGRSGRMRRSAHRRKLDGEWRRRIFRPGGMESLPRGCAGRSGVIPFQTVQHSRTERTEGFVRRIVKFCHRDAENGSFVAVTGIVMVDAGMQNPVQRKSQGADQKEDQGIRTFFHRLLPVRNPVMKAAANSTLRI